MQVRGGNKGNESRCMHHDVLSLMIHERINYNEQVIYARVSYSSLVDTSHQCAQPPKYEDQERHAYSPSRAVEHCGLSHIRNWAHSIQYSVPRVSRLKLHSTFRVSRRDVGRYSRAKPLEYQYAISLIDNPISFPLFSLLLSLSVTMKVSSSLYIFLIPAVLVRSQAT